MEIAFIILFVIAFIWLFIAAFIKRNKFRAKFEDTDVQELTTPIFLKKGYKIWEGDLTTGEVKEAQTVPNEQGVPRELTTIAVKKNCMYVVAMNKTNAERKVIAKLEKRLGLK